MQPSGRSAMTSQRLFASFAIALLLVACGGREDADPAAATVASEAPLPVPGNTGSSVTGMPDTPGPGRIGPPDAAEMEVGEALDSADSPTMSGDPSVAGSDAALAGEAPAPLPPTPGPATSEPGADEAVAVVRTYYEAINAGDFNRAYRLWSDGGKASGQSPQQFAAGFAETGSVALEVMAPGRVEPAAGSRYIEVPMAISATRTDGSVRKYVGAYTLRRAVVDGASAEQRTWHIATADIREVQP